MSLFFISYGFFLLLALKVYQNPSPPVKRDAKLEGIIEFNPFDRVPALKIVESYLEDDDLNAEDKNIDPFTKEKLRLILESSSGYL